MTHNLEKPEKTKYNSSSYHDTAYSVDNQRHQVYGGTKDNKLMNPKITTKSLSFIRQVDRAVKSQQSDLWDTWENSEVDTGAKYVNSKCKLNE